MLVQPIVIGVRPRAPTDINDMLADEDVRQPRHLDFEPLDNMGLGTRDYIAVYSSTFQFDESALRIVAASEPRTVVVTGE